MFYRLTSSLLSGYEGVSEFFTDLLNHIATTLQEQTPELSQLNHNKFLAEQSSSLVGERTCCANTGCRSMASQDPWIVENETNSSVKLQHQRLGCNSSMSPSFQQHCVATLATKASSQWSLSVPQTEKESSQSLGCEFSVIFWKKVKLVIWVHFNRFLL